MNITLRDNKLTSTTAYHLEDFANLQITWHASQRSYHTLIIYDVDAGSNSPYVHLLIVNIPGADISQGNVVISYISPNPPMKDSLHQYYIDIYRQSNKITSLHDSLRTHFPLNLFIKQHGLRLIAQEIIYVDPSRQVFFLGESSVTINSEHEFIIANSTLDEREQAFCSCVVQVAAKQPGACNLEKAWFEERNGEECYNPFAVCANSVGTTSRDCWNNYNFDVMDDKHLQSLAYLHNKPVPSPYDRDSLINTFQ